MAATSTRSEGSALRMITHLNLVPFDRAGARWSRWAARCTNVVAMPSFDVVSEVDLQEVRNAVDQAARELRTRFDFKGTQTEVRLTEDSVVLESSSEGRLEAADVVLKEKLVRRKVSLKSL